VAYATIDSFDVVGMGFALKMNLFFKNLSINTVVIGCHNDRLGVLYPAPQLLEACHTTRTKLEVDNPPGVTVIRQP
jgi:hypothetical protein